MKKLAMALVAGAFTVGAATSFAATDGELSYIVSEGDFDITLTLKHQVRIWGLQNFTFDSDNSEEDRFNIQTKEICIASNSETGFRAYVESENTNFKLKNEINTDNGVPYILTLAQKEGISGNLSHQWGNDTGDSSDSGVSHVFSTHTSGSSDTDVNIGNASADCNTLTENMDLTIALFDPDPAVENQAGEYKDTVTIVVSPN